MKLNIRDYKNERVVLTMHDNGGDTSKGNSLTPTNVWLRDCEIQVEADKNQKISIARENGRLVAYFWTTGITENSAPDYKITLMGLGVQGSHKYMNVEEY